VSDPFADAGFDLERAIVEAAGSCGVELTGPMLDALAAHARAVLGDTEDRHLTSIVDPAEFVDRHIRESLAGAAELDPDVSGTLLDVGSGNGYPGLVVGTVRPGLRTALVEASRRKASFLGELVERTFPAATVIGRQVQRAADLPPDMRVHVLVSRAMGNWERTLPRLHAALVPGADLLVWAGAEVPRIAARKSWSRFELRGKTPLAGRERSWIWRFRAICP
jgi:16S rRNA (guanine527-N7)-methyltransferase